MKKQLLLIGITLAVLLACLHSWRPLNTRLPDRCDGALESNELLDAALQYLDARPQYKSALVTLPFSTSHTISAGT